MALRRAANVTRARNICEVDPVVTYPKRDPLPRRDANQGFWAFELGDAGLTATKLKHSENCHTLLALSDAFLF